MTTQHQSKVVRQLQIMEAASKLIVKRGSEHLTVKSIAIECDISEAAVYRHFKSKKYILCGLADYIGDTLVKDIEEITSGQATSVGALDKLLNTHVAAINRRRGTSFQVIAEIISFGDKKLNAKAYRAVEKYASSLKNMIFEPSKNSSLKEDLDHQTVANLIAYLIQGMVNTWVLSNYTLDLNKEFADMWNMISHGIFKPHDQVSIGSSGFNVNHNLAT